MYTPKLTRRRFVAALASSGAALLAACSGPNDDSPVFEEAAAGHPPTPRASRTPRPTSTKDSSSATETAATPSVSASTDQLTVSIDPSISGQRLVYAQALQTQLQADPACANAGAITIRLPQEGEQPTWVKRIPFVPVVSRRLLVRNMTFADLVRVWYGDVSDWGYVGSPVSHGVVRVTYQDGAGPFDPAEATEHFMNIDRLAEFFREERGALAFIPLDELDFRFRAVNIDDVNVLHPEPAEWAINLELVIDAPAADGAASTRMTAMLAEPTLASKPVSMTWVGDIIIARQVHRRILETGDWAAPFRSIAPSLSWADITIGNLETSLSDSFPTDIDPRTLVFKTDEPAIAGLTLAGIDVVTRSNNHSFNYGRIGMNDTTRVLNDAGIKHYGMGMNLDEARQAAIVEANGVTFAFLGYQGITDEWDAAEPDSPGTTPLIDWMVVEDINREVDRGHVVIPYFHWGTEYVYDPTEQQRYFAQVAIDSGAAVVMGTHPHWVQGVETMDGVPVIYSLGNFVFDQEWSQETKEGMIAHIWMLGKKPLKIDLVPVLIEDYHRPRLMSVDEQWPVLENVWAAEDWIGTQG